MKANELRIGNYVSVIPHGKDDVLKLDETAFESLIIFKNWDRIEPIPLTEEWLLKFGYLETEKNTFLINGHKVWSCNDLFLCDKNGVILKSVHQLQNLYFALTGKEL